MLSDTVTIVLDSDRIVLETSRLVLDTETIVLRVDTMGLERGGRVLTLKRHSSSFLSAMFNCQCVFPVLCILNTHIVKRKILSK